MAALSWLKSLKLFGLLKIYSWLAGLQQMLRLRWLLVLRFPYHHQQAWVVEECVLFTMPRLVQRRHCISFQGLLLGRLIRLRG
jgi:hypothetical protein